jgi:glycogen operon protein
LTLGLYRDLAIGAAPDGAEAWANPAGTLARGVSIGAPPDPFSRGGQVWDLPPPIPRALVASGYAGFRELLAANMRHAGALRIDHVAGLARLFWIPDGGAARDGAYVQYPLDDLVAVLAQESQRAACAVVGEDLGTVPADFRERMDAADILSYRIVWFERDGAAFLPPDRYPAKAAACVSTHDLPTIAGWWSGADIREREELGQLDTGGAAAMRAERRVDKAALAVALARSGAVEDGAIDPAAPHDATVTVAIHRFAGQSASTLLLLQADDLAGDIEAINLPGTDRERPNWRRKVGVDSDALWATPAGAQAIADLAAIRATPRDDPATRLPDDG